MIHLLLWGNSFSQIIRDGMRRVVGLYPLLPNRMSVDRDEHGELVYTYTPMSDSNPNLKSGQSIKLRREDVLHIPGLGFDGLVGYSPIAMARNAVGMTSWPVRNTALPSSPTAHVPAVSSSIRESSKTRPNSGKAGKLSMVVQPTRARLWSWRREWTTSKSMRPCIDALSEAFPV